MNLKMKKLGRPQNYDMLDLLKMLRRDCENGEVTNLGGWFRNWSTAIDTSTVLKGIDIVRKNEKGLYEWIDGKPTEEMAKLVRETTNEYKNYSYSE